MELMENEKNEGFKNFIIVVQKLLKSGKGSWLIVGLGVLGMILIVAPVFFDQGTSSQNESPPAGEVSQNSDDDYAGALSDELEAILSSMQGVGEVEVMVTLSQDSEYIYAVDKEQSQLQNEKTNESYELTTELKDTYVVLDESGEDKALLTTRLRPKIQGAIVVCTGGDNPVVVGRVTEAVSAALGIGSSSVVVTKLG